MISLGSHSALLMRARRHAGIAEQRLARAPKARGARRTSRLRAGSPLLDDPAIGINDSAPDLRATAHRQTTLARIRPLPCLELLRADAPAPHHHDLGRAGRLGPVAGWAGECPLRSGAEDMGPDLVLGHTHQACCDGHLLLDISRKVPRS